MDNLQAARAIEEAQPRAAARLRGMLAANTLPHALLFSGPEGAGKELAAVGLAARLQSAEPAGNGVFDEPGSRRVGALEHPDVHLLFPVPYGDLSNTVPVVVESRREDLFNEGEFGGRARSIGIEQIRRVIGAVSRAPFEGRRSVVILFEAHLATVEAQNAFLKLLEEPPGDTVLVMTTARTERLLPTIISRCQELRFDPVPAGAIARFLETFRSVEPGEAARIAALADGNLRRGLHLLDERHLAVHRDAAGILRLVIEGKAKALIGEAEGAAREYTRDEARELLGEMAGMARLLMRGRPDVLPAGLDVAAGAADRDWPADLRRLEAAVRAIDGNADLELTLSQVFLDLAGKWY